MKYIAFYLPQFHAIPENDEWWGKGFTEWNNVRKSKSLFRKHNQPEIPLNKNYYCLLDSKTQEWQSQLALNYGIDGFCYYHYWFEGKLLLEKPLELMLKNKNIKIPFCLSWANESWARTWDGQENELLIKQNYNEDENGWKKHFEYFLKFFKDERYIKNNGRPVLIIYKPHLIKNCKDMLAFWRKLAKENGFADLYIGYQHYSAFNQNMSENGFDFGINFEPFYTVYEINRKLNNIKKKAVYYLENPKNITRFLRKKLLSEPNIYDYDEIWNNIIRRKNNKSIYRGAFTSWDNTPRKGKNADVFFESTPQKFEKYLNALTRASKKAGNDEYIFINAWNEWAEGAHLEPEERYGYGYLEAIKRVRDQNGI